MLRNESGFVSGNSCKAAKDMEVKSPDEKIPGGLSPTGELGSTLAGC